MMIEHHTDPGTREHPRGAAIDAVLLLEMHHRRIADWFADFNEAKSNIRKQELASNICSALRLHTEIEEKIFAPWRLPETIPADGRERIVALHAVVKQAIEVIEHSSPIDELFDSKMRVLSDIVEQATLPYRAP